MRASNENPDPNWLNAGARLFSLAALALAFLSGVLLVLLRAVNWFRPHLVPWHLKSAYPLIFAGVACAGLQAAVPRRRNEVIFGLIVAAAFILWGLEQFLSDPALISLIDDLVVFLFVFDLSFLVYGHLKPKSLSLN